MKLNKRGSALIILLAISIIIFFVLMFSIYIAYTQINVLAYPIKQDIFYIVQNSYLNFNKDSLKYFNYDVNQEDIKNKILDLIELNYKDKVLINNINYNYLKNQVQIDYQIIVYPVVFKNVLGDSVSINIKDNIKLKSMEVK